MSPLLLFLVTTASAGDPAAWREVESTYVAWGDCVSERATEAGSAGTVDAAQPLAACETFFPAYQTALSRWLPNEQARGEMIALVRTHLMRRSEAVLAANRPPRGR